MATTTDSQRSLETAESLEEIIDILHIHLEYTNLTGPHRDGDYNLDTNTIRLQEGMSHRLHRSVLAHEIAHAIYGHQRSKFGPVNLKQERQADNWAA